MDPVGSSALSRYILAGGLTITLAGVLAGFAILARYEARPGPSVRVPQRCPQEAAAKLDREKPTLFLFVHPQCPCTRATISELDRITAQGAGRLAMVVLVLSEARLGPDRVHGALWDAAARIPGVEVLEDDGGAVARACGVETSGHALLYGADGQLLFEGGITSARGHEGDSAGKASILALVSGGAPACASTPVYGCSLREPTP